MSKHVVRPLVERHDLQHRLNQLLPPFVNADEAHIDIMTDCSGATRRSRLVVRQSSSERAPAACCQASSWTWTTPSTDTGSRRKLPSSLSYGKDSMYSTSARPASPR